MVKNGKFRAQIYNKLVFEGNKDEILLREYLKNYYDKNLLKSKFHQLLFVLLNYIQTNT